MYTILDEINEYIKYYIFLCRYVLIIYVEGNQVLQQWQ